MKKKILGFKSIVYIPIFCILLMLGIMGILNTEQALYLSVPALISIAIIIYRSNSFTKDIDKTMNIMSDTLTATCQSTLENFPLPMITCSKSGEIIASNKLFNEAFTKGENIFSSNISSIFPSITRKNFLENSEINISFNDKHYSVYMSNREDGRDFSLYFVENTQLKNHAQLYNIIRPSIMFIVVDNCEEIIQNSVDSEGRQLISRVEYEIRNYVKKLGGVLSRVERDKFTIILSQQSMETIIESKFDILDSIRTLSSEKSLAATLSIGVGIYDDNLDTLEQIARNSLDMALGRGGDQAAVKTASGYDFFGGLSKGVEKRTKVKARIVANALLELIENSSNVILMGHRFADLDAFGSAVGLHKCISLRNKKAKIAISPTSHLVSPLYERLEAGNYGDVFTDPELLMDSINDNTLLIVLDTHIESFLESSALYRACKNIVVIDHHRRMVGHIDNAVVFFHEPYASSTCEMVSELIPYLLPSGSNITKEEAEALMAGIMLDTKNFVIKTGVRTFEAAAFLRKCGADTVEVRKLFSSSIESYQQKTQLVSSAEVYRNCAIVTTHGDDDLKIVTAQAADELLNITGVDASFVLYDDGKGTVSISARSMGKVNVQIIMEILGGGGHLTMAGSQIKGIGLEEGYKMLSEAIDKYYSNTVK